MIATAHIRDYHKWMSEHHAVAHISAWKNFQYRERCSRERERRQQAGLIVTSHHEANKGHMDCQNEFISWFHKKFGYTAEAYDTPKLIWSHGGGGAIGSNLHHWLVENTTQQMIIKMRWART